MFNLQKTYDFHEQLEKGETFEKELECFFVSKYDITVEQVSLNKQRLGVDRIFTFPNGRKYSIEIKTDFLAQKSHNVFVETLSNSKTGKKGWAYTTTADFLIYFVPGFKKAAVVRPIVLREKLKEWSIIYKTRYCKNKDYYSAGLLVPWSQFTELSEKILDIE